MNKDELVLAEILAVFREHKLRPKRGDYGYDYDDATRVPSRSRQMCAVGALAIGTPRYSRLVTDIAEKLRVHSEYVYGIVCGFDGKQSFDAEPGHFRAKMRGYTVGRAAAMALFKGGG